MGYDPVQAGTTGGGWPNLTLVRDETKEAGPQVTQRAKWGIERQGAAAPPLSSRLERVSGWAIRLPLFLPAPDRTHASPFPTKNELPGHGRKDCQNCFPSMLAAHPSKWTTSLDLPAWWRLPTPAAPCRVSLPTLLWPLRSAVNFSMSRLVNSLCSFPLYLSRP